MGGKRLFRSIWVSILLLGCSAQEDLSEVRITDIHGTFPPGQYCVYYFALISGEPLDRDYFLIDCGTHAIGDIVVLKR